MAALKGNLKIAEALIEAGARLNAGNESLDTPLISAASNGKLDIVNMLIEKGAEVGAHILSGAVLEPTALDELFPDWKDSDAPVNIAVSQDELYFFTKTKAIKIP